MLGPYELLDKIMEYGKDQFDKDRLIIQKNNLWDHVIKIDPSAKIESLNEVINELDARGCLSVNNEMEIKFDPNSFQ